MCGGCSWAIRCKSGVLLSAQFLKWSSINIQKLIAEELPCNVVMENTANALCISHVDDIQNQTAKTPDTLLVNVTAGMGASFLINNQLVRRSGDEGWIRQITVQSSKRQPTEYFFCPRLCLNVCLSLLWQSKKIEIDQGIDFACNRKRVTCLFLLLAVNLIFWFWPVLYSRQYPKRRAFVKGLSRRAKMQINAGHQLQ